MQFKNLSKRKGLTDFCKSVRPFLFILFVLVQFLYQHIVEALRRDNLMPMACSIELRVAITPAVIVLFGDRPRLQIGRLLPPSTEHLMEPCRVFALEHVHPKMYFSITLADFQAITVLKRKQRVHEAHIGVYVRHSQGMGRDLQYLCQRGS